MRNSVTLWLHYVAYNCIDSSVQWAVVLLLDKEIRAHQEPQASFIVSVHKNNSFMGDPADTQTRSVMGERKKKI